MSSKKSAVVLVFNNKNELALQLRSSTDTNYPSHWDASAAGSIDADEEPEEAASRELWEEIGITGDLDFIKGILYKDDFGEDYLYVYRTDHNGPFIPDKHEVQLIKFVSLEEIDHMIETGEKFHPEFIFLWKQGIVRA
jgi:isopentenyl-diphosphate Delta-isomerase